MNLKIIAGIVAYLAIPIIGIIMIIQDQRKRRKEEKKKDPG